MMEHKQKEFKMGTTIDLSQGQWRFHTIHGLVSKDYMAQHPAQSHGENSDFAFSLKPLSEVPSLPDGIMLDGTWLRSQDIVPEDAWDYEKGKGKFYVKVFAASSDANPGHQVIQIYQTEYHWLDDKTTGDLTIYTGRLYQPTQPDGQP